MVKDQFIIPGSPESSPLADALRIADSSQYTPENQPAAFHLLKTLESKIDSCRETAIEMGEKKSVWSKAVEPFVINTTSYEDRIIERESRIGGTLYPSLQDARFWLHKRHKEDRPDVRSWYFSYVDGMTGQRHDIVYRTTPHALYKNYAGLDRPFPEDEQRNFVNATMQYAAKVRQEMYPLDDMLEELQSSYELAA